MLAQLGETCVITRRDYRTSIERALMTVPERDNLTFVYVDLPERFRTWQRDLRGLRTYYLLWQMAALKKARHLQRCNPFNIVWHLTWANAWYGSLAPLAGRPFVYGPVGGCVGPPWRLLPQLGWPGAPYEVARAFVRGAARYLNPLARLSWHRADLILAQNVETRDWFPRVHRAKVILFPNAVISEEQIEVAVPPANLRPPLAIYAGRLEPWKGVFLCLQALALLPEWTLVICGSGNDKARLQRLAGRLGVTDRVEWLGWLPQEHLLRRMSEADVFLFPSLREEAGAVIAEARAVGVPVVCLARGGPPLLTGPGGRSVPDGGGPWEIAGRLADAALETVERRRRGDIDGSNAEPLLLHNQAERLRELIARTLPGPVYDA
jgi:glycosyltransferase involved in cell wall biosynthesis